MTVEARRLRAIPWWEPLFGPEEQAQVLRVLESGYLNDGEVTEEFERRLAAFCGVPYAVAMSSGTAAIFAALSACGIRPGDEVIVPDFTFVATANAVSWLGATPVLVDVDPNTFCLDAEAVRQALSDRTKAIIPVHVNGRSADVEAIVELAIRRGLVVVEDAAEALGSRRDSRALGTFGRAGCLSFASSKLVTTGQGGAVLTSDPRLRDRLRELKDQGRRLRGTGGADAHPVIGYNLKLTNLQAAVGIAQLERLPSRLSHLRQLVAWYHEALAGLEGVEPVPFDQPRGTAPLWADVLAEDRDALAEYLALHGIGTRTFWRPLHTLPPYRASAERFPRSEVITARGLWLPSSVTLTRDEVVRVSQAVAEFVRVRHRSSRRAATIRTIP